MNQKLHHTLSTICAASLCLLFLWSFAQLLFPTASEVTAVTSETAKEQYLLKEYEGKIALFLPPDEEPDTVYPIYVNMLPQLDRKRLERGIHLTDQDTVNRYIADFES